MPTRRDVLGAPRRPGRRRTASRTFTLTSAPIFRSSSSLMVERVDLLLRVLRLLRLVEQAAELRGRRCRDGDERNDDRADHDCLHTCASLVMPAELAGGRPNADARSARSTTSKIATGLVLPLTTTSPSGLRVNVPVQAAARRVADDNPSAVLLVQRFEPRSEVHGVADHRVAHDLVRPDVAGDHRSGVDADPDVERRPALRRPLDVELLQLLRSCRARPRRRARRARGSSSGAPKSAITMSPTNLSTVPL